MMAYLLYTAIYIILPIGSFGFFEKAVAFKNISFFPFVYFLGRLIDPASIWLDKFQTYILFIALAAAVVLGFELVINTHLQQYTGYASFYEKYFDYDPSGNYGLSWSFEIEGGIKRFASFFANPLEHAAATLLTVSVLVAWGLKKDKINQRLFYWAILASILSIVFALSRASLAGYLLVTYLFFWMTGQKKWLHLIHAAMLVGVLGIVLLWANGILGEFVLNTIDFSNSSSLSHLIEWVDGIDAMMAKPLGMGLGESGRVAGALGLNTGGENQLIIIGVQTGIVALLLYIAMYVWVISKAAHLFLKGEGKAKQLGVMVFILKIGLIVPILTASVESYLYVSFVGWFLVGLLSAQINTKVSLSANS
jgi:hypothetical protein